MNSFHTTVLGIAVVILILLLTVFGIIISRSSSKSIFPPTESVCPDYWTVSDVSGTTYCTINNNMNIGDFSAAGVTIPKSQPSTRFDTNDKAWTSTGTTSICGKKQWANSHKIVWDGVSNYTGCK